jgi:trimeric autotransporter adhesin
MKKLIKLKTITLLLMPLVLACFALLPSAQAATPEQLPAPPPDGGYAGFNTAEGLNALKNVNTATGVLNSAFGFNTLTADTTGAHNTAVGGQALLHNNGSFNTAVGENALVFNTTGSMNMALGQGALANNLIGNNNTAMGFQALNANTASSNTAVGFQALRSNTTTSGHTAIGFHALTNATPVGGFLAFGDTAIGANALGGNTTGTNNVAVGPSAGANVTDGNTNTFLGVIAGLSVNHANNVVCIGPVLGADVDNRTYIANIGSFNQPVSASIKVVTVNPANNLLGFASVTSQEIIGVTFDVISSQRYKDQIKPLDKGSEVIYALKPVSFRYKADKDPTRALRAGLIAEEVQKVDPDLVVRDEEGKPERVRFDSINAMVLNEFLKEHQKVQKQEATIAELKSTLAQQQKGMEVLTAQLKEQAAQIQKVSAQVEMSKPAPTVVTNQ